MAESVDALVSNTSRFTPVPVRPRLWVPEEKFERTSLFFVFAPRGYSSVENLSLTQKSLIFVRRNHKPHAHKE